VIPRRWNRHRREPQIANAHQDFAPLAPVSDTPAETTRNNWSALLPGQDVPLIWERNRDDHKDPHR
jgi:hypothetical protein